jgi:hypothetical protein
MRPDRRPVPPTASEAVPPAPHMDADSSHENDGVKAMLLGLIRAVEGGDTDAILALCVAVLATLLVLATCCVIRLRWRISHLQGQTREQGLQVVMVEGEGERSRLHPKKGRERSGTASPSAAKS